VPDLRSGARWDPPPVGPPQFNPCVHLHFISVTRPTPGATNYETILSVPQTSGVEACCGPSTRRWCNDATALVGSATMLMIQSYCHRVLNADGLLCLPACLVLSLGVCSYRDAMILFVNFTPMSPMPFYFVRRFRTSSPVDSPCVGSGS